MNVGFVCCRGFATACGFAQAEFGTGLHRQGWVCAGRVCAGRVCAVRVCAGRVCADWVCTGMTHEVKLVTLA